MKKDSQTFKRQGFFFLLLFIQILFLLFGNRNIVVVLLLLISDGFFLSQLRMQKKEVQLTDLQEIEEATKRAKEALAYVSDEMPVAIITWDKNHAFTWANPYIQGKIATLSIQDQQDMVNELLQRKQKGKNIYRIGDELYRFYLTQDKRLVYLIDITKGAELEGREKKLRPVVGILSVDNYDDIIDRRDDKEISYIDSFITTIISDWLDSYEVFYKRINAERVFFIARYEDLEKMIENNFNLLDYIRISAEKEDMLITISMGISYGDESLELIGDVAQNNLDIALVRGGDQAVVKEANEQAKPVFYGGHSASAEKRTRVRSRAMSTALKNVFSQTGNVYVMGHRFPDMDALGSSFGVACLARFHDKNIQIIINEKETIPDVDRCLEEIHKYQELENLLVSPETAIKQRKAGDLLVMVDYHRPSLSVSQDVYEAFENVVIIDHHRRGEEFPDKSLLTYIESSASSASELVTELIQFESNEDKRMTKMDATLLLAGMTVDTKSFAVRTTARTFDVASYLKTCGADASLVQYLLSTDIQSYLEISKLIGESQYVRDDIVIATGSDVKVYDTVTSAKTADTLLSMVGINAAFVITKRKDNMVAISARSSGVINVQKIMEVLGGGGHFTNAAAQLSERTITAAKQELIKVINQQLVEGEKEE